MPACSVTATMNAPAEGYRQADQDRMHRERFAPSPTGFLHLGHAFSALTAWDRACHNGGLLHLRLDDLDTERCRPDYEAAIIEDLRWLGIRWSGDVMRQSERRHIYETAIATLSEAGLCYPCQCSRRDIRDALSAPHQSGLQTYPGTCRERPMATRGDRDAIRLNLARVIAHLGGANALAQHACHEERGTVLHTRPLDARALIRSHGDIVIARQGLSAAYHLAVVIDDAAQAVTHVTRGEDLAVFAPLHRLLQLLLGLPAPIWTHHRLILDDGGQRLAKRRSGQTLRDLRAGGATPADIRARINLPPPPD